MTKDDIIRMAREAGLEEDDDLILEPETIWYITLAELERFAALVAAAEREWVDLSDDDVDELQSQMQASHKDIRIIEAAIKEKNA